MFATPISALPFAHGSDPAKAAALAAVEAVSGFGIMLRDVNLDAVQATVIPDTVRAGSRELSQASTTERAH